MQITIIVHIPSEQLKLAMEQRNSTVESFKEYVETEAGYFAQDIIPGITASVTITD
jgi:hypothetical protein